MGLNKDGIIAPRVAILEQQQITDCKGGEKESSSSHFISCSHSSANIEIILPLITFRCVTVT